MGAGGPPHRAHDLRAERTSAARAPDVEEARNRTCWSWRTLFAFVVTCALARFAYFDVIA
jgi:hypothetical protein